MGGLGGVQLRPGAKAGIDQPLPFQPFQAGLVKWSPQALEIGPVRSLFSASLVPGEPGPEKVFLQQVCAGLGAAVRVQVLDPQHHLSSFSLYKQPGQQGAQKISQMHASAGSGSESSPYFRGGMGHKRRSFSYLLSEGNIPSISGRGATHRGRIPWR